MHKTVIRVYKISLTLLIGLFVFGSCSHFQTESTHQKKKSVKIKTQEVPYSVGELDMVGYLALPESIASDAPAVLVVHEWWGQTNYPRKRAEMLAKMGYVAFAVDMYGNRRLADHPRKAGAFSQKIMSDARKVSARFKAALEALKKIEQVDQKRIAAMGYCFGGSVVLEMMRQGLELKGYISFHGGLITPSRAEEFENPPEVLIFNGEKDPMVKKEHIKSFKNEMEKASIPFELVSYENATHGFTNPEASTLGEKYDLPIAYNENADRKSWEKTKKFLTRILNANR